MASAFPGKCATITAVDLTNPVKNIEFFKNSVKSNLVEARFEISYHSYDVTLHNIILQLHCSVVLKKYSLFKF